MEGRFSGVSFGFALQLSFDNEKFECFRIGLSFKQDTFHKSRERKGGGDLILVVRIFMRGVSVRSFVYFLVSVYFLSLFKRYFDRRPDIGRGLQIVCDKRIVDADGLFADREMRDLSYTGTDLRSSKSGRLGGRIDRVLDF